MRRRIIQLAKAADQHLILHADGSLSQIEAELVYFTGPHRVYLDSARLKQESSKSLARVWQKSGKSLADSGKTLARL